MFLPFVWILSVFNVLTLKNAANGEEDAVRLILLTVATEENDAFKRYKDSALKYGYDLKVLGLGEKWTGGNVAKYPGGGQKIRLLKAALEEYKNEKNLVVAFTDSYDVVFQADAKTAIDVFKSFEANLVFSAERSCWPDPKLAEFYPTVNKDQKRYLNSGAFVGYGPSVYEVVSGYADADDGDDQLYYSKKYLADKATLNIKLDIDNILVHNLNGAAEELTLKFEEKKAYLVNKITNKTPVAIHGNGPVKTEFNRLTNYVPDRWTPIDGCLVCQRNNSLSEIQPEAYPSVLLFISFNQALPFGEDFLQRIFEFIYPKKKIDIIFHYQTDYFVKIIDEFVYENSNEYATVQLLGSTVTKIKALEIANNQCMESSCEYILYIDAEAHIEKPEIIEELISLNKSVVAPMLVRLGKMWSNFWGAINAEGYYSRSEDYVQLVQGIRKGTWNVPYLSNMFLIRRDILKQLVSLVDDDEDLDISLCHHLRNKNIFMYVNNEDYYGHLVNGDEFDQSHLHNDLYALFTNKYTWEKKYLHKDYLLALNDIPFNQLQQPCPDVFWLPLTTPIFCKHLIEEMENFGQWSGGKNSDPRLTGGYENVPTVDIHTNQIGWEKHWLQILKDYVGPLNAKAFEGYYTEARAIMNFVVRYRPDEQDRLRPHADSSTYTINLSLNDPDIDYKGGGVRLVRYNCTITALKKGWMLMHPGKLTHYHEGLPTTWGTRYIMVSFIDP